MVNPAGVDIERKAQQLPAHHAAFQMPARRAPAPRGIPFHLPRFARRGFAPDRKVGRMALALDFVDAAPDSRSLAFVGPGAGQPAIIGDRSDIEIQPARQFIAMRGRDGFGKVDHLRHKIGGDRPVCGRADIQRGDIGPIGLRIMARHIPDRLRARGGSLFHLVFAIVGVVGQMPDIGDIDHMRQCIAFVGQRAAQHIGKHIRAHVTDMWIVINRGPAGIDPRLPRMDGHERFKLTSQAVEQHERAGICHDPGLAPARGAASSLGGVGG